MNRLVVIVLIGLNSIALTGIAYVVQLAHYRLQHIETALGINSYNPDGQMRSAFEGIRDGIIHLHEQEILPMYEALEPLMEEQRRETFRPFSEQDETVETRVQPTED